MVKNSTKLVKMVKTIFFSSNKSRMVKKCQTGSNMVKNYQEKCQKLSKIVNNFQKKSKIVKNGLKWQKIIKKNQKFAPVIQVLPRCYPGIFPGILGNLGTPVFLNWPLATLSMI